MHKVQMTEAWAYLQNFWRWRVDKLHLMMEVASPDSLPRLQGEMAFLRVMLDPEMSKAYFDEYDASRRQAGRNET
jgi:hypothetical protein